MRSIMYHYVREYSSGYPNFRFLDVENFRLQLDYFQREYGFLTHSEWNGWVNGEGSANSLGKVVLTFDDAMACHYKYVYPELRRRGLWGIFYVPSAPYVANKILDVHRVHLLCGAFDGRQLLDVANNLISDEMIDTDKLEEFRGRLYEYQDNYQGVTEFKKLANYFINYDHRGAFLDAIQVHMNFHANANDFYVSIEQLKVMADNGMVIGSHSHSHPVMSRLDYRTQILEIELSLELLNCVCPHSPRTYCHPYGGFHSFDANTVKILNDLGFKYSFNVEPREIQPSDFVMGRQHLPRFDCNLFPHGRAS